MPTSRFAPLLFLLIPLFACADSSSDDSADTTREISETTPAGIAAVPDSVLIAKGVPDPSRTWATEDMQKAYTVLFEENGKAPGSLPRYDSTYRSAIFARMIAPENMAFLRSDSLSADEKAVQASEFTAAFVQIYMLYAGTMMSGQEYTNEVSEMMVAILKVEAELASIARDFVKTVPGERRNSEQFKAGLQQMQDGIAQSLSGTITVLRDKTSFSSAQLEKIARTLGEVAPDMLEFLSEEPRTELLLEAEKTLAETDNPVIQSVLRKTFSPAAETP